MLMISHTSPATGVVMIRPSILRASERIFPIGHRGVNVVLQGADGRFLGRSR